jgi:hypothetical protein
MWDSMASSDTQTEGISDGKAIRLNEFLLRKQEGLEELEHEGFANWLKENII